MKYKYRELNYEDTVDKTIDLYFIQQFPISWDI